MTFDPLKYIESKPMVERFVRAISENTEADRKEVWTANLRANRENVKRDGWSCTDFFEKGAGKAAIIIGASPALTRQIDQLKELQKDSDFILIGISAGIRYLLQNGIRPDYTFISDSSDKMLQWFEGIEDVSGMWLCADITANLKAVDLWREKGGKVKYHAVYSAIKSLDHKIAKWYRPLNGTGDFLPSLSSQYNSAVTFAFQVLNSEVLIFVGNELSFPSADGKKDRYYVDRADEKDHWIRKPHIDIYGKAVYTTFMFYQMKLVLEDYLGRISGAGYFFNATEAGIFGVTKDGPVPWIRQFTLRMAVKQARHILTYGRPLTSDILARPILTELAQYTGQTRLGGSENGKFFSVMPSV
jgi:hypothetical protein